MVAIKFWNFSSLILALLSIAGIVCTNAAYAATQANVILSVSQSSSPIAAAETITYQITASNTGNASATFTLYASVPASTTVISGQSGGGGCSVASGLFPCQPGQSIFWGNQTLSAGQSASYQFSAQLNAAAPADGTIISTTVSTSISSVPAVSVLTVVRTADGLNLGIACPPSAAPSPGGLVCLLNYSNSSAAAIPVSLNYSFPASLTVLSASSGAQIGNGIVTWNIGTLAAESGGQEWVSLQIPTGFNSGSLLSSSAKLQDTSGATLSANASTQTIVAGSNPLQIGVSATPDPVQPGQTVTYSIKVSNTGGVTENGFTLRASVPNGTTVISGQSGGGGCSVASGLFPCQPGQEIVWGNQSLAVGQSATYQFAALVNSTSPPANGTLVSTVVTTGVGGSGIGQALVGSGSPVLALSAAEQIAAGGTYAYTLTYGNSGTSSPNTQLVMAVPPGTMFVSASPGGTLSSGVVTWNLSTLQPGQAGSAQLTVQAPTGTGTVVSASAEVIDTNTLQSYSRATSQTTVASANPLQIGVSATPDPVQPGQTVTYTIEVSNSGSITEPFTLLASVPNGATVISGQSGGGGCSVASGLFPCQPGQEIVWGNQSLAAGQSATYQFAALVNSTSPPANGSLVSTVVTTRVGGSGIGQVLVGSGGPVLALSAAEQIAAGGTYAYTLTYGNSGTSSPNTQLVMAVPPGTTFVSASPGSTLSSGVVTWSLNTLKPGQAGSAQLTVQAPTGVGTVVSGSAEVIDTNTLQSYSRAASQTTIASTDPLQVSVSATPDPAQPGQTVTYTIKVSNAGSVAENGFTLRASVPNGTTVLSGQSGGGGCSVASGLFPCQPGQEIVWGNQSIAAGQSATYQFAALVNGTSPPANGTLVSTVVTTGVGGSAESSDVVGTAASVSEPSSTTVPLPVWTNILLALGLIWIGRSKSRS
jgi:uncharacterized repeat protein (TIGR01451 family)